MRSWTTHSVEETWQLGERLAGEVEPDGVVLLIGDLGSGKTALTQGIARGLGIEPSEVQSPTFTLMREHRGASSRLVHIDLYRLEAGEIDGLGLEEILQEPSVKVIEWADRFPRPPRADLVLELTRVDTTDVRQIRETTVTPSGATATLGSDAEVEPGEPDRDV